MKNLTRKFIQKTLTILCVFISLNSFSQYGIDWENNYDWGAVENAKSILQTNDGGYIVLGHDPSTIIVIKTDALGNFLWKQEHSYLTQNFATSIIETEDNNFVISGYFNNGSSNDVLLLKIDSTGSIIWDFVWGYSGDDEEATQVKQTFDKGYIISGHTYNPFTLERKALVIKIDSAGTFEWENQYLGNDVYVNAIVQNVDSGYIFLGEEGGLMWRAKINNNGGIIWQDHDSPLSFYTRYKNIVEADNRSYVAIGTHFTNNDINDSDEVIITRMDSLGNNILFNTYGLSSQKPQVYSIEKTFDNGFIIAGSKELNSINTDVWVFKIDSIGNLLWEKTFGGSGFDRAYSIKETNDDSYIIAGITYSADGDVSSNSNGGGDFWLIKIKPLLGSIYGITSLDNNSNCLFDSGDTTVTNILVQSQNTTTNYTSYSSTSLLGEFNFDVDTTSHIVTLVNSFPYLSLNTCSTDTQIVNLSGTNLSDTVGFYLSASTICPYMEVDISNPLLRRCFSSNYYVSYCNNGTITADSAYVEVEFDPILVIDSASIPWTSVTAANVYTFPIGDIDMFDCGSFSVSVSVPCDTNTFLGQILCAEAHIFPDSLCLPSSSTWNGAELDASAECIGTDTVEFTLKNIGSGNMNIDVPIIVIEDVFLIMDTQELLNAGTEIKWKFPTNGLSTHRMIAQQPADHPYKTFTTDAISLCNTSSLTSPGPIIDTTSLAYPNDEESPFEAVDCQAIIGAYDPNDKTAYPVGVSSNHYISKTTDLEYKIRFQNTGTDTAFTVVITDSISNLLDIATFNAGASSHTYTYNIYGSGIVDFTFNNILLADSFVNEPASHGFVQYKIKQKASNQAGDIIYNNADIFFDYNLPVRTNTTFNEIGGIFLDTIIYKFPVEDTTILGNINGINEAIKLYPNPSNNIMYVEFEETQEQLGIELFDLTGKIQQKTVVLNSKQATINKGNLNPGVYLFKIYSKNNEIAFGRLIFN